MMIDLNPLLDNIRIAVERHRFAPGKYTRYVLQKSGLNAYGCADAANIRYSLGDFPADESEQFEAVRILQDFQDPATGLFRENPVSGHDTHHPYHITAHCSGALKLLNAHPRYPLASMMQYLDFTKTEQLLDSLDWTGSAWGESHKGAGVYAALANTDQAGFAWRKQYFDYLDRNADPEYGLSRKGAIQTGKDRLAHHLNGWFHYLFCYHHANRPFPYPEKLIDTCLKLRKIRAEGFDDEYFGKNAGFQEIDWIFPLNRAIRQTPYRFEEVKKALYDFAVEYIDCMTRKDPCGEAFDDLHCIFGMVCALSELYLALPGMIQTEKPLRNVLDVRPFI